MNYTKTDIDEFDNEVMTSLVVLVLFLCGAGSSFAYFVGRYVFGFW